MAWHWLERKATIPLIPTRQSMLYSTSMLLLSQIRWVITGFSLSVLASAQEPMPDPVPSDDRHQIVFEGKVGDRAAVRAVINVTPDENGGSKLAGTYHYVKQGKVIHLWGNLEGDRASLEESALRYGEPLSGRFDGTWTIGDSPGKARFEGSWTSGDGQRKLPFSLTEAAGSGSHGLDFYFFAEEYARKQGSQVMQRAQSLAFPQLRGQGEMIDRVNGFIRSLALLQLDATEDNSKPMPKEPLPTLKALENAVRASLPTDEELKDLEIGHFESLTFEEDFEVMLNAKGIFSMRTLHSEYTGGAHPNSSAGHVTFDLKTGEELTLDDLMKPGWRDPLNVLAEAQLRAQYELKESDSLNDKGPLFEDVFELNDNWFLSPEGLGFSFDPYEIGPYAAGFIELVIPYSKLKAWVKPGSALERIVTQ